MLTDLAVRQAVEFESSEHPVLSLYLNVDPHRRTPEKYKIALRNLLSRADGAREEDCRKIQNYVEMGYNWQGRGIILFSCAAEDFWWAQNLPVVVEDEVFVSHRPYVHQLATLIDAHRPLGVIHVDQMGTRLYLYEMGHLEAVEGYLGEEVRSHKAGGWSAPRYQRHEKETARQNLQDAAELAENFYRQSDTSSLILAGTEKNVARFREMLSNRLRKMVVGELAADSNASAPELQEKASEIAQKRARDEGAALTDEILTAAHKGQNGVVGLADTLNAVQTGRAQHVVLLSGYSQPAFRYRQSRYVVLSQEEADASGSQEELEALPDAVDSVLRRSLLQGIGVTVLDEHPALEKAGKIGALTRY